MLSYLALLSRSATMWIVAQTADKSGLWAAWAAKDGGDQGNHEDIMWQTCVGIVPDCDW